MKPIAVAAVLAMSLVARYAWADDHAMEFSDEVKKGEQRAGFTNKTMVKTQNFTVGAIAVKDEIKAHKHNDGSHVLYIVSDGGTMMNADRAEAGDGRLRAGRRRAWRQGRHARSHVRGFRAAPVRPEQDGVGQIARSTEEPRADGVSLRQRGDPMHC